MRGIFIAYMLLLLTGGLFGASIDDAKYYYKGKDYINAIKEASDILLTQTNNYTNMIAYKILNSSLKRHDVIYLGLEMALYYIRNKDYNLARERLKKIATLIPDNSRLKDFIKERLFYISLSDLEQSLYRRMKEVYSLAKSRNFKKAWNIYREMEAISKNHHFTRKTFNFLTKEEYNYKNSDFYKYYIYALKLYRRGKIQEALNIFKKAYRIEKSVEIWRLMERIKGELKLLENKKIRKIFKKALALYNKQKYERAKEIFLRLISMTEDNKIFKEYIKLIDDRLKEIEENQKRMAIARDYFNRGVKAYKNQEYKEAISLFENALAYNEDYKDAREYLKKCYEGIKKQKEEREKQRLKKMEEMLTKVMFYYSVGKYEDARDMLYRARDEFGDNENIKFYLELVENALKERYFGRLSPENEYYPIIQSQLKGAIRLYKNKEYAKALKIFEGILLLFPKEEDVLKYSRECIRHLDPQVWKQSIETFYKKGKSLLNMKKYKEAKAFLEIVAEIEKNYKDVKKLIAIANHEINKLYKRKHLSKREIQEFLKKALDLYTQGKYKEAIVIWKEVLKSDHNNREALLYISKANYKLKIKEMESKETTTTGDVEKNIIVKKHYFRGLDYYNRGLYELAIKEWEKVLEIDPNNIKARNNILKCKARLKVEEK